MAKFESNLSAPDTKFTKLSVSPRPDARKAVVEGIGQIAQVVGKSVAKSNAADITGADLTLEEVNDAAEFIDNEIDAALTREQDVVAGPLQASRVKEIKDIQLSEFARNDRVLLALRDGGTITTKEANARRRLNLQRELSNPINALFKGDFLNAVADLTGGATGAARALFPLTAEEEQANKISQARQKAISEVEGKLAGLQQSTGKDMTLLRKELQEQEQDKEDILTLDRISRSRALSGEEVGRKFSSLSNNAARGVSTLIAQFSKENGGRGFDTTGKAVIERTIAQQHQSMIEAVNQESNMGNKERDDQIERLRKWRVGMDEMAKIYDVSAFNKGQIELLEEQATLSGWKTFPELMYLNSVSPELLKVFMASGGTISGTFDRVLGAGTGEKISKAANVLGNLADFVEGKPVADPSTIPAVLSSPEGIDWLNSQEVKENKGIQDNLRIMYNEASEQSLRMFTGASAKVNAPKDRSLRQNIDKAMSITRNKILNIKQMLDVANVPITAKGKADLPIEGTRMFSVPRKGLVLDLPDNMVQFSGEIKELYRTIEAHPWAWEHVKDEFKDVNGAFNAYLRGEWEINLGEAEKAPEFEEGRGAPPIKRGES